MILSTIINHTPVIILNIVTPLFRSNYSKTGSHQKDLTCNMQKEWFMYILTAKVLVSVQMHILPQPSLFTCTIYRPWINLRHRDKDLSWTSSIECPSESIKLKDMLNLLFAWHSSFYSMSHETSKSPVKGQVS